MAATRQAIEAAHATLLFIPPYSPDLNPIELAFSKLKALLRAKAIRTTDALWKVVGELCGSFSPAECASYFRVVCVKFCKMSDWLRNDVSLFGWTAFPCPGLTGVRHRAERRARLAAGHRRRRREAVLRAASPMLRSGWPGRCSLMRPAAASAFGAPSGDPCSGSGSLPTSSRASPPQAHAPAEDSSRHWERSAPRECDV